MKTPHYYLLASFAAILSFASCTEQGPNIDFGPVASDTSYTATPETAEPHRVFFEEFTGVTCPNCPQGHALIAGFRTTYPDRVVAVGYHNFGLGQSEPVNTPEHKSKYDFRTQKGTELANNTFGGVPFLPSAIVDRVLVGGELIKNRNFWPSMVSDRIAVASPINLTITNTYDEAKGEVAITVRGAFTAEINTATNLTVGIIENHIADLQENETEVLEDYEHEHVFRDFLTPGTGAAILNSFTKKSPGLVYERTFIYKVSADWNVDNCVVFACIHSGDAGSKEVYQAAEKSIK